MFVITPYNKVVNLNQYAHVNIEISVTIQRKTNWSEHHLYAVSLDGSKQFLASWEGTDDNADKARKAYKDLISALEAGQNTFDINRYL